MQVLRPREQRDVRDLSQEEEEEDELALLAPRTDARLPDTEAAEVFLRAHEDSPDGPEGPDLVLHLTLGGVNSLILPAFLAFLRVLLGFLCIQNGEEKRGFRDHFPFKLVTCVKFFLRIFISRNSFWIKTLDNFKRFSSQMDMILSPREVIGALSLKPTPTVTLGM